MTIIEEIEKSVKDTVDYNEAKNKESFMVGAQVASKKLSDYYEAKITNLQLLLASTTNRLTLVTKDMTTVSDILNKYKQD